MKSNRVSGNKNYISIKLPKRSVPYSATAVKTFFFFSNFCKTKKNVQISVSLLSEY